MHQADSQPRQDMAGFSVSHGQERYRVEARAVCCGRDINVIIGGGTHYHIGASALAIPRSSLADAAQLSASASVICVTGHKEDELARQAALSLASSLDCIVNVVVGIHIDNASTEEIKKLINNFNQVINELQQILQEHFELIAQL